ncbi:MAG: GntR family transcriptional regulator [Bacillota bacterium]|nr:GntR family transcriptional regulator [Bacillota bacterium]
MAQDQYKGMFDHVRAGVPSVTDMLYHTLRRGIVSGALAPGEHLVERDISRTASVSRTPIREAFRRLEAEGLVRHHPRRGVEVVGLVPQQVEDVFAVRKVLQGLMAERAAANATPEEQEMMAQAVREAEELVDHRDGFILTQDQFNNTLIAAARMPLAAGLFRQLSDYLEEFRARSLWNRQRRSAAAKEHRLIWEAVVNRDPVAARAASDDHADRSAERVRLVINPNS